MSNEAVRVLQWFFFGTRRIVAEASPVAIDSVMSVVTVW